MFDFERQKQLVAEHYFKIFRSYKKPNEMKYFIQRWLAIIKTYCDEKGFITFDPDPPVFQRLVPRANAVAVVYNTIAMEKCFVPPQVSVIPYFPYRVILEHDTKQCSEQLEFLKLYLELTDIRLVGFHGLFFNEVRVISELQKQLPHLEIYGSKSFENFKRRATKSFLNGLKFQSRSSKS